MNKYLGAYYVHEDVVQVGNSVNMDDGMVSPVTAQEAVQAAAQEAVQVTALEAVQAAAQEAVQVTAL